MISLLTLSVGIELVSSTATSVKFQKHVSWTHRSIESGMRFEEHDDDEKVKWVDLENLGLHMVGEALIRCH